MAPNCQTTRNQQSDVCLQCIPQTKKVKQGISKTIVSAANRVGGKSFQRDWCLEEKQKYLWALVYDRCFVYSESSISDSRR